VRAADTRTDVKLSLHKTKHKSKTRKSTLHPEWKEEFKFAKDANDAPLTLLELSESRLKIEVYDWDSKLKMKKDDFLGEAWLDLSSLLDLPYDEQMAADGARPAGWHLHEFAVRLHDSTPPQRAEGTHHGFVVLRARWDFLGSPGTSAAHAMQGAPLQARTRHMPTASTDLVADPARLAGMGLGLARDRDDVERIFRKHDGDGSGDIDVRELRVALKSLGIATDSRGAAAKLQRFDASRDGALQLHEFRRLVEELRAADVPTSMDEMAAPTAMAVTIDASARADQAWGAGRQDAAHLLQGGRQDAAHLLQGPVQPTGGAVTPRASATPRLAGLFPRSYKSKRATGPAGQQNL
jgi:hypothetical protein